jgi:hypothetical protein
VRLADYCEDFVCPIIGSSRPGSMFQWLFMKDSWTLLLLRMTSSTALALDYFPRNASEFVRACGHPDADALFHVDATLKRMICDKPQLVPLIMQRVDVSQMAVS